MARGQLADDKLRCLCGHCSTCRSRHYARKRRDQARSHRQTEYEARKQLTAAAAPAKSKFWRSLSVEQRSAMGRKRAEQIWAERQFEEYADGRREQWRSTTASIHAEFAATVERIRQIEAQYEEQVA